MYDILQYSVHFSIKTLTACWRTQMLKLDALMSKLAFQQSAQLYKMLGGDSNSGPYFVLR